MEREKLNPEDFPHIDYWYKHQWTGAVDRITNLTGKEENEEDVPMDKGIKSKEMRPVSPAPSTQRGQGRSRLGINVSMRYVQLKDGTVIDGHRATEMRNHARAVFVGFADDGKNFASWGEADAMSRRIYYNEMAFRFEELSYCELDWKAEQIATDIFPGWKLSWANKQNRLREETTEKSSKRTRQESVTHQKRFKGPESTGPASASLPPAALKSAMPSIPSEVRSVFFVSL